jgi:hypothetical protein
MMMLFGGVAPIVVSRRRLSQTWHNYHGKPATLAVGAKIGATKKERSPLFG